VLFRSEAEVNAVFGKPTPAESWLQSIKFVDGNNSGQVYPGEGWVPNIPTPPTE
jgi:hypothetical protein